MESYYIKELAVAVIIRSEVVTIFEPRNSRSQYWSM